MEGGVKNFWLFNPLAFLHLWAHDDLMNLHPRFIEYDVLSATVQVLGHSMFQLSIFQLISKIC